MRIRSLFAAALLACGLTACSGSDSGTDAGITKDEGLSACFDAITAKWRITRIDKTNVIYTDSADGMRLQGTYVIERLDPYPTTTRPFDCVVSGAGEVTSLDY